MDATQSNDLSGATSELNDKIRELAFNQIDFGRQPEKLVSPQTEDELVGVIRSARESGRQISILSGGHSWTGSSIKDGGVLIDLSAFSDIAVDVEGRKLRIGPAVRGGEASKAVTAHGLAYPSGHCATPGSGGYLLGGGIGLNPGHWKPACFSVQSARVVTATGEAVTASETENADLLWMVRGAGPAFPGVVTEFEIALQDRPADTRVSTWVFDFKDLQAVTRWVSRVSTTLPSWVEVFTSAGGPERHEYPPSEGYPDYIVSVIAIAYVDTLDEAREALRGFSSESGATPLAFAELESVPFEQLSTGFDAEYPEGFRYIADAFWSDLDVEGAMAPLSSVFPQAPSGRNNYVALMPGNGSLLGLSSEEAAFSMDRRTLVMAYAIFEDAADDDVNREWMKDVSRRLDSIASGYFISEADLNAYPNRLPGSFSEENLTRLREIRAKWDPEGLFALPGEGL